MGAVITRPAPCYPVIVIPNGDRLCVGIKKKLLSIVIMPSCRVERPENPVTIKLSGLDAGHKAVPVVEGLILLGIKPDQPYRAYVIRIVKQEKFNSIATTGE